MELKSVILFTLVLIFNIMQTATADFFPNRHFPSNLKEAKSKGLICPPGRTRLKLSGQEFFYKPEIQNQTRPDNETGQDTEEYEIPDNSKDDNNVDDKNSNGDIDDAHSLSNGNEAPDQKPVPDTRRFHMRSPSKDESCQVCVCSVEGLDENCLNRPARNINECILMMRAIKTFHEGGKAFNHERILSQRIRRDYIWHGDELPYRHDARCARGVSYYTNNIYANESTIELPSDVDTPLDYRNSSCVKGTPIPGCIKSATETCLVDCRTFSPKLYGGCYFCICHTMGIAARCLKKASWICKFQRQLRDPRVVKRDYKKLFESHRPTYFPTISQRMRRTMDDGVFDLLESGGDALCCDHPSGHRRTLHNMVKTRLQLLKKQVQRENLLHDAPPKDYADFVVNND